MTIAEFKAKNAEAQAFNVKIQQARGAIEENKRQFAMLCAEYKATYGEDVTADNIEQLLAKVSGELAQQVAAQERAINEARESIYKVAEAESAADVGTTEKVAVTEAPAVTPAPTVASATPIVTPAPVQPASTGVFGDVQLGEVAAPPIAPIPVVKVAMPHGGIITPTAPAPVTVPEAPAAAVAAATDKSRFIKPVVPAQPISSESEEDAPKPAKVSLAAINNASMVQSGMPDVLDAPSATAAPTTPAAAPTVQSPWGGTGANANFNILGGKFGG